MARPIPPCRCGQPSKITLVVMAYTIGVPKEQRLSAYESTSYCTACSSYREVAGDLVVKAVTHLHPTNPSPEA